MKTSKILKLENGLYVTFFKRDATKYATVTFDAMVRSMGMSKHDIREFIKHLKWVLEDSA